MSVLILSQDESAARSLGAALDRRGVPHGRIPRSLPDRLPLVVILDVAATGFEDLLERIRDSAPWSRCYLIANRGDAPSEGLAPIIQKPFDASALAEMLERECELAALDRRRRSLAAHTEELGLLLESSLEAIIGLDYKGVIVFWNRGAERTYGYTEEEAIGKTSTLLGDPLPTRLESIDRNAPSALELVRRHKDGRDVTVIVSRSRSEGAQQGALIECAEVSLDVTEHRALQTEVEHSQRLAQLGRMAATLSHEINNPLAVIRSNAGWLSTVAQRSQHAELVEVARDLELAAERIATFIDQMTGFARRGSPVLELAPLSRSLDLALRMVRPRAEASKVTLIHEAREMTKVSVAHDPTRFAHAVINVLANAIDAASHGGGHVWLRVASDRHWLAVEVDDDGPGISPSKRGQVFEPFYTTKPFGRGTGLGLWLTQQILNDHSGEIRIDSRDSGGARVKLLLPLPEEAD
jgi:PAS domain S-box-containing protein